MEYCCKEHCRYIQHFEHSYFYCTYCGRLYWSDKDGVDANDESVEMLYEPKIYAELQKELLEKVLYQLMKDKESREKV